VSSLQDRLYLLRGTVSYNQIEVYDVCDSYRFLHHLNVPALGFAFDIVVCGCYNCAYISDTKIRWVHRVPLDGSEVTGWPVNDVPSCLSLTFKDTVLVTCRKVDKIKEFATHGEFLREIDLQTDGWYLPWHAVQLCSGDFVVCHGDNEKQTPHGMSLVNSDGAVFKSIRWVFGQGFNTPSHMAVDGNEFIFVIDRNNCRVLLLPPTLTYAWKVVSCDELEGWKPYRLSVDVKRRLLYVAVNEHDKRGDYTAGRVVVIQLD